jgi:hypothetical protein
MIDQLDFGASKIWRCWRNVELRELNLPLAYILERSASDEDIVDRRLDLLASDADPTRGISLRVRIDEQRPLFRNSERGSKIDGGGRFPHPALLIGNSDYTGHETLP